MCGCGNLSFYHLPQSTLTDVTHTLTRQHENTEIFFTKRSTKTKFYLKDGLQNGSVGITSLFSKPSRIH